MTGNFIGTKTGMTKGKILIVDDCSMNIELLQETLASLDYEIVSYSNPFEALEKEKNTKIDMALLDVVMPGIDGFKFAEQFLEFHHNTPIVFVSAHSANENKIKGYNLGSFVYIEKPFDVKTIRAQFQSILKLKKVQDELLKEKNKLNNIFEFTSNEMILTDIDFNIISQNNKILDKDNYSKNNFLEILSLTNEHDFDEEFDEFINSDKNHMKFRIVFEKNLYTKATISKMTPNKIFSGYLIILEDITEEVEKQNMRNHFIEMLTHDLKTPIRAEKRALELLLDNSFGEISNSQKEILQEILFSSRYMLRMTDNILTRYKIDSGDFKIKKAPNNIKKTIENTVDYLKPRFKNKKQKILVNTDLQEDSNVFEYDEIEVRRVLTNIIANASEYSPVNTEIKISIKKEDENIQISVADEGPGLTEKEVKTLLDTRRYSTKRFKKIGSGMGIFVTKKIVEAHNGKIEIITNKTPQTGTTFTVHLPCKKVKKPDLVQV